MSGGQKESIPTEYIFIGGLLTFIFGYLYLSTHFYVIATVWKNLRIAEFSLLSVIPDFIQRIFGLEIDKAIGFLKRTNSHDLKGTTLMAFDSYYSRRLSWIPAAIMIFLGVRFIRKGYEATRIYSNESLLKRQSEFFSHLEEFTTVHPESMELRFRRGNAESQRYSMSVSPEEFAKMCPPLGLEAEAAKKKSFNRAIYDAENGDFDSDLAERAFKKQLGLPYTGLKGLTVHEQKLYGLLIKDVPFTRDIMLAHVRRMLDFIANGKGKYDANTDAEAALFESINKTITLRVAANGLIPVAGNTVSQSIAKIKNFIKTKIYKRRILSAADFANDEIARGFVDDKSNRALFQRVEAESIMARHAYNRTGLMSLLVRLRDAGNYPPNLWKSILKGEDRTLWYCVTSVGKFVSFAEAGGCFSHWLVECFVERPIHKPEVSAAVEGLRKALKLHYD